MGFFSYVRVLLPVQGSEGGQYTELFDAIIPTLFLCFLLICYPYILFFHQNIQDISLHCPIWIELCVCVCVCELINQ